MDYLTFDSFISISVLILFYYIGAVIIPLFVWHSSNQISTKYHFINIAQKKGKKMIWKLLSIKQRIILIFIFISMLSMMELVWRMMFEFLIAYMQIRDALVLQAL